MKKRILAVLLALVMIVGLLPTVAFAVDYEGEGSYWYNFRNSDVNMAITDTALPTDKNTTYLKWAKNFGSGWMDAPSVQIIVDNALVTMVGTELYILSLEDGSILAQTTMSAAPNYGYTPPIYVEGLIICPLANGTLEAFKVPELTSAWKYTDELGGQSLTPITYSDGKLYTGFWNDETREANYVCVDIQTGNRVWNYTSKGGFYWAGSVVVGDAVIFGTDDGEKGSTGNSNLLSLNKNDGTLISKIELTGMGDQRSSIAYSEKHRRVYFTTKNGYLCSAYLDADSGELSELQSIKIANQATGTPVVFEDTVYVCAGSGVVSGSGGSGSFVYVNADDIQNSPMISVSLPAYPQCSPILSTCDYEMDGILYFYLTCNGKPGGITLVTVDCVSDNVEVTEIFDAKGYEQYCITSPICDKDGTIYYKNDSGYIFAVAANTAYLDGLSADVGYLKESFSVSATTFELVVPIGTTQVKLNPTACEGAAATVTGGNTITLSDGTGTATIVVTKDGDKREYTVNIREENSDTTLSFLKVNESNSFSGNALTLTPTWNANTHFYGMYAAGASRNFENLWVEATDATSVVKVYALNNVRNKTSGEEIKVTATNANHNRYAIYFADGSKPVSVRVEVTAENGDKANYYLVMSKTAAAEQAQTELQQLEQNVTAANNIVALIDQIGKVDLYAKDKLMAARVAFDALNAEAQSYVTNYNDLLAAEEAYMKLIRGEDGKDGVTPQLRINEQTNMWEVSYDQGKTWTSLNVPATGDKGDKGEPGKDGVDGTNGKDGVDGTNGKDGIDGKDGVDGTNGKDGVDGKNGADGKDGKDGQDASNALVITALAIAAVSLIANIALAVSVLKKKREI